MAQTKQRRKTKHRGNAAGIVESRGRTGRKPTADEKAGKARGAKATQVKKDRFDKPPTWKGAFYRSMIAAVLMLLFSLLALKQTAQAAMVLFPVILLLYVPISYYSDLWLYRRRRRQKAAKAGKA